MEYTQTYSVDPAHIDSQNIVDGLYYPFYMEKCRHAYIKDVLGFDINEMAKQGVNMVLSEYTLKFKRPLKLGDQMTVTCSGTLEGKFRMHFAQKILVGDAVYTEAVFSGTCIPAAGGRPFVPPEVAAKLAPASPVA